MPHILFILDYYYPHCWGVETVFEQVISRLLKKWYRITLLTSRFDSALLSFEEKENLTIYRVGSGRLSFLFAGFWKGLQLLRKLPQIKNIHASTYGSAIQSSILWLLMHKHVILTVHEVFGKLWFLYKWFWKGLPYLLFERLLFCFPYDMYHCVSRYTMNSLRLLYGISDKRLHLIHNGVDYDFWNPSLVEESEILNRKIKYNPTKNYMSLYYGHAGKSKWLDVLVKSIPTIIQKDPDFLFVFNIIDSKRKSLLISRLQDLQRHWYAKNIQIFYGMDKEDLRVMIAACDVVVAPSLSEWFGSVHTEAVAMGKVLITTFVASIPEVVSGRVVFVQPDSSQAIREALISLKKNQNIFSDIPTSYFYRDDTVTKISLLYK